MEKVEQCDTCGMNIDSDYIEHCVTKVGNKEICSRCNGNLKKYGFLQINEKHRLLLDGTIIKHYATRF